ncbi:DEKNAAC101142 [Brettanomyces naardenensis]|uniref:DEKNAAC101142 n=1 Tax=Brettanomyces naardenensis TaxID=13370 RepID=A0A448YHR8_BRENA|nr:DEKNAAC101142 [Brettanomyces naardenensis]
MDEDKSEYIKAQSSLLHQSSLSHFTPDVPSKRMKARGKVVTLYTKEEIESFFPNLVYVRNFLPEDLAARMLDILLSKRAQFTHNEFYIAGQKCKSTHSTAIFKLEADDGDHFGDVGKKRERPFFPEMKLCQYEIQDKVNELLAERKPLATYQIRKNWCANLCVGNLFENGKQNLDWHSDKLTAIGPLAIVASITFGATRIFRVKKTYSTDGSKINDSTIFNLPLQHNTLLVMLSGTQEEYKHCVPSIEGSLVERHPVAGDIRINLTYRMIHPALRKGVPKCPICGEGMILKRMFKHVKTRGYYFWLCQSQYKGYKCKGFYFAKFDRMNEEPLKLYTTDISEATRWVGSDDSQTLAWMNCHMQSAEDVKEEAVAD